MAVKNPVLLASGALIGAIVAVFCVTYGFKVQETSGKPISQRRL
jgi:hypothetical protein